METIIIDKRRELKDLPELWYTDGTDEANEWARSVVIDGFVFERCNFIASHKIYIADGAMKETPFKNNNYTYITESEFLRLVHEPWKESQKVKLPETYGMLIQIMITDKLATHTTSGFVPAHVDACIQLTNIMNFANDAFEGNFGVWIIDSAGDVLNFGTDYTTPIRFTSMEAADWAYKTFPEIFKAYWNV